MVLTGTIVNAIAIIIGGLLGAFLSNIPPKIKVTVMQGIGLAVLILGVKMGLETKNFLLVILSIVLGSVVGEILKIEDGLDRLGKWIEGKIGSNRNGNVANAFVTATLVYTIGAMAILGALNSGLDNNHQLLYLKSMLDGFSAIVFASTLGFGVVFSAIPVFIYQGTIAILAKYIHLLVSQELLDLMILEITATGGVLIIAIALNVLEIKKVRVGNMLPAIIITPIGVAMIDWITKFF